MSPIVELKIIFAAPVTVESIAVKVSVNFEDPSPENHDVRLFHTFITPSFSPFHLLIAVVDIESQRPER